MALSVATCKAEFKEAMRARLVAEDPALGANVDRPDVDANFEALGTAVFEILTDVSAPTSDGQVDQAYWEWVAAVDAWVRRIAAWQQATAAALQGWQPATAPEIALKTALSGALPAPPSPPMPAAAPATLTVELR